MAFQVVWVAIRVSVVSLEMDRVGFRSPLTVSPFCPRQCPLLFTLPLSALRRPFRVVLSLRRTGSTISIHHVRLLWHTHRLLCPIIATPQRTPLPRTTLNRRIRHQDRKPTPHSVSLTIMSPNL